MTLPSSDNNDLEKHLNRLISLLPQWSNGLSWSQVLFLESTSLIYDKISRIPHSALTPSKDYAKRFDQLLNSGYHWINMNAFGIWEDNLIVVIELPGYKSDSPRDKVSVNFSGPMILEGKPQWDLSNRIEVFE